MRGSVCACPSGFEDWPEEETETGTGTQHVRPSMRWLHHFIVCSRSLQLCQEGGVV